MPLQTAISTAIQDDTNIVTGVDAGTTTNVGHHASHHVSLADAANRWTGSRVFNVEHPDFGAVPDEVYFDGVSTAASATFTASSPNAAGKPFTSADIGKNIMIFRAGDSSAQDHHSTIASINSATSVQLTHAAGRSQNPCRFYLSRAGSQQAAFDLAITAAYDAHGGLVYAPGVAYLITGLTLKRRVVICGVIGKRATCLHLAGGSNKPVVKNDQTLNNSADFTGVFDLWLDGNRKRQTDWTWNQDSTYTAGSSSTVTITGAQAPQPTGAMTLANGNIIHYNAFTVTDADTWVLTGVSGGIEGTTDTTQASGATITQHQCHGVYFQPNPYVSMPEGVGSGAENFDPRPICRNVMVHNVKGNGYEAWGQSGANYIDCSVLLADRHGFRTTHDVTYSQCHAAQLNRSGFMIRSTQVVGTGNSASYCGGVDGYGFFFEGPTTIETGGKVWIGSVAQDNKKEGVYCRNSQRVMFSGQVDSNGTNGTAGQYAGIKLEGATNGVFDVMAVERMQDGSNAKQQNAIEIQNTAIVTAGNQIRISHGGTQSVSVGPAIKPGSTLSTGNSITVNGEGGYVNPAFSTPYVPDPYAAKTHQMTLTGNLVVSAPSNAHLGTELRFVLVQDATGGRTITFNAALPATWAPSLQPAGINIIDFVYNGTAWVQTSPPPDAPLRKTLQADATDSTSATNTTLTDLTWALAANTDYTFSYLLWYGNVAATTTGLSIGMTCPAGATLGASVTIPLTTTTVQNGMIVASAGTVTAASTPATGQYYVARVDGQVRTAGTAGNLTIDFGPDANAAITVRRGSQSLLYVG